MQIKHLILTSTFALLLAIGASAQCPVMPTGFLCISQAAGNEAASNKRELEATKAKVTILETALTDKDKSIEELKNTNKQNIADLTDRLHKTEVDYATATGQVIELKAALVNSTAMLQFMLEHGRVKQNGLINVKL